MTMRFGSLLLLVFLCSAEIIHIQSDSSTCECTEVGECLRCDENGCNQVSSCNGKRDTYKYEAVYNNRTNATERMITNFNAISSGFCKCMKGGYCEESGKIDYQQVKDCSAYEDYTFCDAFSCTSYVHDGGCYCESGTCMKCHANGCKLIDDCIGLKDGKGNVVTERTYRPPVTLGCQLCDHNGCEKVPCLPECYEHRNDIFVNEKCDTVWWENPREICGELYCKKVRHCDRIATCKCDLVEDTYTRCHGFEFGTRFCRTLDKCSDVLADIIKAKAIPDKLHYCDCHNGRYCYECNKLNRCHRVKSCDPTTPYLETDGYDV